MKLNWNFQGDGRVQTKTPSLGEVWILLGTKQLNSPVQFSYFLTRTTSSFESQTGQQNVAIIIV